MRTKKSVSHKAAYVFFRNLYAAVRRERKDVCMKNLGYYNGAYGAKPVIVCPEECRHAVEKLADVVGLHLYDEAEQIKE